MLKQDEHGGLRGLGHRSAIPYIHRESCCIVMCCSSLGLNLPKRVCMFLSSVQPFIAQGWTVTL
jgi:phage-related holin